MKQVTDCQYNVSSKLSKRQSILLVLYCWHFRIEKEGSDASFCADAQLNLKCSIVASSAVSLYVLYTCKQAANAIGLLLQPSILFIVNSLPPCLCDKARRKMLILLSQRAT